MRKAFREQKLKMSIFFLVFLSIINYSEFDKYVKKREEGTEATRTNFSFKNSKSILFFFHETPFNLLSSSPSADVHANNIPLY